MPSKDADGNSNSFKPDQAVSLWVGTVCTEKCYVAIGNAGYDLLNEKLSDLK